MTKSSIYIGSKIPENLNILVQKAVAGGIYLNRSEFVRIAIKEKIIREGQSGGIEFEKNH